MDEGHNVSEFEFEDEGKSERGCESDRKSECKGDSAAEVRPLEIARASTSATVGASVSLRAMLR